MISGALALISLTLYSPETSLVSIPFSPSPLQVLHLQWPEVKIRPWEFPTDCRSYISGEILAKGALVNMGERRARRPFLFSSCMELREVLGKRATDESRLLELIEEVPGDSIYYHTHSYYLRHAYTQQLYPNDFATWVVLHAQDRLLGERLGVLDPFAFSEIEQLRDAILAIMGDHLNHTGAGLRCITSEPFEFIRSYVIEIPLSVEAGTLREFRDALGGVEVGAVYNHVCEARMRRRTPSVDFASWLGSEDGLGMQGLAMKVEQVGRLGLSLEGMRKKILSLCEKELARPGMFQTDGFGE